MVKIHEFRARRPRKSRSNRLIAWSAVAVAVLVAGVVSHTVPPHDADHANVGQSTTAPDFDYFPSHYRNQATEPAEPIATF